MSAADQKPSSRAGENAGFSGVKEGLTRQLDVTRRVIGALQQDLQTCRERNRELDEERVQLLRSLAETDIARLERDDLEAKLFASERRRRDLEDAHRRLQREHEKLLERCADLEDEVENAREFADAARAEIHCLEEQVEELQGIANLVLQRSGFDKD